MNLSIIKSGTTRYCVPPNMIQYEALRKYFEPELNQESRANLHFQKIQGTEEQGNDTTRNKRQIQVFGYSTGQVTEFLQEVNGIKKGKNKQNEGRKWDYYI